MQQRKCNPVSRQREFQQRKQQIARTTIENFEKMMKKADVLKKQQKEAKKDQKDMDEAKQTKIKEIRNKVATQQKNSYDDYMARSLSNFHRLMKDTKANIEYKRSIDN